MKGLREHELLLWCGAPVRGVKPDVAGIDWRRFEDLAESHRLLPLAYWALGLPGLKERFQTNLKNSLLLTRELVQLIDLLGENGIPVIPFKGPTLALRAYRNLALRNFCDLDILVRREDVWKARDVLAGVGFTCKTALDAGRESAFLDSYDELVMYGPGGTTLVEIHWEFVPQHFAVAIGFGGCVSRLEHLPIANRTLPSLHPDDMLMVLCAHGSKHCWSHLGLVCDVAWLVTAYEFDWEPLIVRARRMGTHRMMMIALTLARDLFGVNIPLPGDPVAGWLAGEITESLFGRRHDESSIAENGRLHLRMRERVRDRVRYVVKLATRPGIEDFEMVNLPVSLNFLYRVLRFPRLAIKYLLPKRLPKG